MMKYNISLLVGLKNNIDYTKFFYQTTRLLYPDAEICFVSYGSTDETHKWLNSLTDNNLKYYISDENKTFSDTYNKAAELATNDYVAYLHNDIVLSANFIENIQKHINQNTIVGYTTIEPPIFAGHSRPGKIILDMGADLNAFEFNKFISTSDIMQVQDEYANKIQPGATFFMCMPRKKLLEIGGMDNLFNPMFCEDDDLINRFKLLGLNMITSLDAMCYHFVSKTSRFSDEFKNTTRLIEKKSNRNFVRKWGGNQPAPVYDISFIILNANMNGLRSLEPFSTKIYINAPNSNYVQSNDLKTYYINEEQPNTKINLSDKIFTFPDSPADGIIMLMNTDDIIVTIDLNTFIADDFNCVVNLRKIINESGTVGDSFELGHMLIRINKIDDLSKNLIKL